MRWFKVLFLALVSTLFIYQSIVDNPSVCGSIGSIENHCLYHISDADHSEKDHTDTDHICVNCPCNFMLAPQVSLAIRLIYIDIHKIYLHIFPIPVPKTIYPETLIRPPRLPK